jgi:hypothetical protein
MIRYLATVLSLGVFAVLGVAEPAAASHGPGNVVQTPHRLALGKVPLNTTVVMEFTVTNKGTEPVTNTGFSLSYSGTGGFVFGSVTLDPGTCTLGGVLAPGESCTYSYAGTTGASGPVRAGEVCYLVGYVSVEDNVCSRFSAVIGKG